MDVASQGALWWDGTPGDTALGCGWIRLDPHFFRAITAAPVPVDLHALRQLKRSPLALDRYGWLCHAAYRAHTTGKVRFVAWPRLAEQLGAEYTDRKNFGRKARAALRKVAAVYPDLRLGSLRAGVRIAPESFPAIQSKPPLAAPRTCWQACG
jgi:hypothetical protein